MRRYIGILIVMLMMTSSQAKTKLDNGGPYMGTSHIVAQPQTVTPNARAHVRIPKFKLLRANPYRLTHFIIDDTDDDFIDDDGLITPYRRRDLVKIQHPNGISEKIRWRLFLARQLALLKYNSKWA